MFYLIKRSPNFPRWTPDEPTVFHRAGIHWSRLFATARAYSTQYEAREHADNLSKLYPYDLIEIITEREVPPWV